MYYVIYDPIESDMEDSPQFWNNENGWGELKDATIFTERQRWTLHLPACHNCEWVKLPHFPCSDPVIGSASRPRS